MRKFKFRAWDDEHNTGMFYPLEWFFGDVVKAKHPAGKTIRVIPMQFTGQHDKNGREVYAGDILVYFTRYWEDDTGYSDWTKCIGEVYWDDEWASYQLRGIVAKDSSVFSGDTRSDLVSALRIIEAHTIPSFTTLDPMTGEPDGDHTDPIEPDDEDNNGNKIHNAEIIGNIYENPELLS